MNVHIRLVTEADRPEWVRMRHALWPDEADTHTPETQQYFADGARTPVFVAERDGRLIGFLELRYRNYAEGCDSSPVPFIEGWYVDPELQGQGIGRALVEAAEASAKAAGYTEIGSDVLLVNKDSIAAHKALGYEEVERLVCFRKSL